jgi:hypothetical protein
LNPVPLEHACNRFDLLTVVATVFVYLEADDKAEFPPAAEPSARSLIILNSS